MTDVCYNQNGKPEAKTPVEQKLLGVRKIPRLCLESLLSLHLLSPMWLVCDAHPLEMSRTYNFQILRFMNSSIIVLVCFLTGCLPSRKVTVVEYAPLDWTVDAKGFTDIGCIGRLPKSCAELIALGCDEIRLPRFYLGGLQPSYGIMECIHEGNESPDKEYFRQQPGLDTRYRSYVIFKDGKYWLIIKQSEFKKIFAPVESPQEAISYAMAITSLSARYDIDPNADVDYLVDVIEETHAEETSEGYIVYLFDTDRNMGCGIHSNYAVKVLVTRDGEVHEVSRQEIYKSYSCFDFGMLMLDEN